MSIARAVVITPKSIVLGLSATAVLLCVAEWLVARNVPEFTAEVPRIMPATAVLLILDAAALMLAEKPARSATVALATGIAIANLLLLSLGIFEVAVRAHLGSVETLAGMLPSPDTAAVGAVLAIAIALVASQRPGLARAGHVLALVSVALGTFVLIAHVFHARKLYSVSIEIGMSPVAAVVIVLLACAALSVAPRHGLIRVLYSDTEGGRLARQFLPIVLGAPLMIAGLVAYGLQHGLYTYHAEIALLVVAVMFTLAGAAWRYALNVDATEGRLERLIEERTRRLTETIDEIEEFSQALAHDFRGPLINLREFLAMVLDEHGDELSELSREYLERADRAGRRLDRLTSAMLRYTELSRRPFRIELVDTAALAHAVADGLAPEVCGAAAIQVVGPLPRVWADEQALHEVLQELLTNACRFARPGETPRVVISCEGSGTEIRLLIRDEGVGVAPEHHDRIFRPFEQLARSVEHPGIGLALVRRAVTKMNGRAGVSSDGEHGSTFWIELPGMAEATTERAAPGAERPRAAMVHRPATL